MSIKILMIADDKEFVLSVTRFMGEKGIAVLSTEDAETGNNLLEQEKPDVLIINVVLKSKPIGLYFVSSFKANCANKSFPVIMLSKNNHVLGMDLEAAFADESFYSNVSFFAKPIELTILYSKISELLNNRVSV